MKSISRYETRVAQRSALLRKGTTACLFFVVFCAGSIFSQTASKAAHAQPLSKQYGKLPLYFEQNIGQTSKETRFISRGSGYALFLTNKGSVLELQAPDKNICEAKDIQCSKKQVGQPRLDQTSVLSVNFLGTKGAANVTGDDELEGKANYFVGNDSRKWTTRVPIFTKVHYSQVYPGVDVVYYGNQQQLEYDLVLQAKVDPAVIRMGIRGANKISLDKSGDLLLKTATGTVTLQKPFMYQMAAEGKKQVLGEYVLRAANEVGFKIESYNKNAPLIVDPVLVYSTYFGGTGQNSGLTSNAIAVDAQGNTYITGTTTATDFPASQTIGTLKADGSALMFVTKINPSGTGIVYSTYLGGTGTDIKSLNETDEPLAIAADANGYAYVSGETSAPDFPTTSTAYQTNQIGALDAFLVKLSADGQSLLYSTYFGGGDYAQAIGVDANQNAYLTGSTQNATGTVPITANAYQTVNHSNNGNAFVSQIDTTKSGANSLIYSTFLGGSSPNFLGDIGGGIAADSSGKICVTGTTSSTDFPVTATAYQTTGGIPYGNAFVSVFDPTKSGSASLVYSSYFGGTGTTNFNTDFGYALALDQTGKVYIAGFTDSVNFPTTVGGQTIPGIPHAFVAKFDTTQSGSTSLIYSRALGNTYTTARALSVDSLGDAYVGGATQDAGFSGPTPLPLTPDAVQATFKGSFCGFITVLSPDASTALYSTYFGSSDSTGGFVFGLALDANSNFYVAGETYGIDIPTTEQLFQPTLQGTEDLFIAKFSALSSPTITNLSPSQGTIGTPVTITGTNFGSSQGASTVTFNGVTATPTSWSPTSIAVMVPTAATNGNVVVTVAGVASNGLEFEVNSGAIVTYDPAASSNNGSGTGASSATLNVSLTAGELVHVDCEVFGAASTSNTVSDSLGNTWIQAATISVTDPGQISEWYAVATKGGSDTIQCQGATGTTYIKLGSVGEISSTGWQYPTLDQGNEVFFSTSSPCTVSTLSPTVQNSEFAIAGCTVTGTVGSGSPWTLRQQWADTSAALYDSILSSSGIVSFTMPTSSSDEEVAWITTYKPNAPSTVVGGPSIADVFPTSGTVGTSVTITGTNFGATQGTNIVTFNGTAAAPTAWSATSITVPVPTGATTGNVMISNAGIASNGMSFTVLSVSTITGLSPTSGSTGTSVTISGTNFGSSQGTSTVTFNGTIGTPTLWSATSIKAPVPTGATTGNVVVIVNGVATGGTHTFTVSGTPTISSLSPTTGAIGTSVTIHGTNFGSTQGASVVTFNGVNATPTSWSSTQIKAPVPSGATTGNIVVTVSSKSTTGVHTFTVSGSPTISGMTPNTGGVGTVVIIAGTNLGTTGTVTFNGVTASPWNWNSTQITVPVPPTATSGSVVVTIAGEHLPAVGSFTVNSTIPSAATEYSYDAMGRVVQTMTCTPMNCGTGQGFVMNYAYDLGGDLTTLVSSGTTVQYSPADSPIDAAGRVTKVEGASGDGPLSPLVTIDPSNGYWPTGAVRKITYGNNLTESSVYNNQGQPCRISVNSSGALLSNCSDAVAAGNVQDFSMSYGSSDNGNIAGFAASGQQNFNRSYTYDSLNRLQTMSAPGDQCSGLSWTVDAWTNRTAQTTTGGSCYSPQVSVDSNNRLSGAPYQYDAAGNLLNDGNHSYTYDAENRVTQVDGGNTATYVYDATGKRIEKIVGGSDSQYLYDIAGRVNTVFGNGAFQRMYAYLNGQQVGEFFNGTVYFISTDHLGSTRLLTGLDGSVQESDDYYPYGEPITTGTQSLLKFTGKERDTESGLDNFGARYYGSSMGRFMTPDWAARPTTVPYAEFGDPQSLNLYGYVRSDPITRADADGHISEEAACPDPHGCSPVPDKNPPPIATPTNEKPGASHSSNSSSNGSGFWGNLWHHAGNLFHGHSWNYMHESVITKIFPAEPNSTMTAVTDVAGLFAAVAGKTGKVVGPAASILSVANNRDPINIAMNGIPFFVEDAAFPLAFVGAEADVLGHTAQAVGNGMIDTIPGKTMDDGNGTAIANPAFNEQNICQDLGCN
jgi:RHS repeat-associated protein